MAPLGHNELKIRTICHACNLWKLARSSKQLSLLVKFTRYCLTQWILKLPMSFEIYWVAGIILCMRPPNERRRYNVTSSLMGWVQGWGEYSTYEYEYWKISTRVVLEYNVFSIFMFIILGKTSTRVVLTPALAGCIRKIIYGVGQYLVNAVLFGTKDLHSHYTGFIGPCLPWGRILTTCVIMVLKNGGKMCQYIFR